MPTLNRIGKDAILDRHTKVQFHLLRCDPDLSAGDPDSGNLLEELDQTHFLEHPLHLTRRDTSLSEAEFSSALQRGQQARISISDATKQIEVEFLHTLHQQMALLAIDKGWTVAELVHWLDRAIPHPDIPAPESVAFINRLVQDLLNTRGLSLDQLVHDRYRLAAARACS